MYNAPLQGNPRSLDPQFADDSSSNTVIKNLYSGLMMKDSSGNIEKCNAESYTVSEDGLVYTFKLRDNFWFFDENNNDNIDDDEFFPVTADDYAFALRRVLDPKMKSPYGEYFSCIKGGRDALDGRISVDSAGISTPDEKTLEITLEYPSAEFLGMMASAAAYPCNEEFFDSTKGRYGLDDRSVMSNGAFYVRRWFYDPYGTHNILYMRRNTANENEEYEICPSYLSFTIEKNESDITKLFSDGSIECFTTLDERYDQKKYSVTESFATTLGIIFNDSNVYFANKDLRRAIALATDRQFLASKVGSDVQVAYGVIPPGVNITGRQYRDLCSDEQYDLFNIEEAKKLLDKAKAELKVGTFESIKLLVCNDTVDSGCLRFFSQNIQDTLSIYIGIEEVSEEEFYKRIDEGNYSIALYPVSADLESGLSVIRSFENDERLVSASDGKKHSQDIMRCAGIPELVEAYSVAEREIIENYGFIPLFYKKSYLVAEENNEDIFYDAFTGAVDYRLAKNYS